MGVLAYAADPIKDTFYVQSTNGSYECSATANSSEEYVKSHIQWGGSDGYWVVTQATKYNNNHEQKETGYDYGYYSADVSLNNARGNYAKFNVSVQPYNRDKTTWGKYGMTIKY